MKKMIFCKRKSMTAEFAMRRQKQTNYVPKMKKQKIK